MPSQSPISPVSRQIAFSIGHRRRVVVHELQHAEREAVKRHVADVRARVREAHDRRLLVDHAAHFVRAMVRDERAPAELRAVLHDEIEERVDGMLAARFGDFAERFPDEALVRTCDDERVVEVPMPHARRALVLVVFAKASPIRGILHERVALDLGHEVQERAARAELLEDDEIDAVGVDLERDGQRLPAKVPAEERLTMRASGATRR